MATLPAKYYDRFDASKNYDQHLFLPGRGLQSAELNEIQKSSANRVRQIADILFKDGDIIRDAVVSVNATTGVAQCGSGAIYLRGAVRGVTPATLTIPMGVVGIGVRLVETVVDSAADPALLDPATGTRNYLEPGADRLRVETQWAWDGDGGEGQFFPIYSAQDRVLGAKEPPPNIDAFAQSLARYDRDSAGGCYIVSGLKLQKLPDVDGSQVYSLSEGRARVYGYGVELSTSRRITYAAAPDLKAIANEPHLSSTNGSQRVDFDRTPGTAITAVSITAEKTVNVTHGVATGASDPLPDTSILQILEVKQGATTYTATTDYVFTAGQISWSPAGAEPAPGSTYTVKYRYITNVTPTAVDEDGFTVDGAVSGTLILVSYSQKLRRYDRLCLDSEGHILWVRGVASDFYPQIPNVPTDVLPVATVFQTWGDGRVVIDNGVRVVPMPALAAVEGRMDLLAQLIAQQRLESNIHTRETGTKKGLFTDPFLDESQRDAGTPQTAAVVDGVLMLPIAGNPKFVSADIALPATLARTNVVKLSQPYKTGAMKINPYMGFDLVPASVTLTPAIDRWTETATEWLGPTTSRFVTGANNARVSDDDESVARSSVTQTTRTALIARSTVPIETLRSITVTYHVEGFGPGEAMAAITFDGVSVPTGGVVANASGIATGSFVIPAGIPAGNKDVRFVGAGGQAGSATFSGQGTLERQTWQQQTTIQETRWQSPPPPPPPVRRIDPLAQTLTLEQNTQITGVDLWFTAAPTTDARIQIRATATGLPTQEVLAEKVIKPSEAVLGGGHTRIIFDAPVSLIGGVEYAIVALCNDPVGELAIAEMGKFDEDAERWITSQPYTIGVLLSSSNASTWTPHQDRDMTFRLLGANYTELTRNIALGTVSVTDVTDLLLMSYAERPASETFVQYTLTLPDSTVIRVTDGENVQLNTAVTGDIAVAAALSGSADFSPVLFPGTQVVAGTIATTADYVSRAIPAGTSATVKVIYEGIVPSGSGVAVFYKGQEAGDTWQAIPVTANNPADDGYTEFIRSVSGVNELTVQIKIVLTGTAAARPYLRDLRVIVS